MLYTLDLHKQIAEHYAGTQNADEGDYEYRKRVFLKIYPIDGLKALEMLFCAHSWKELLERDSIFITMAREMHFEEGEKGLIKFLKGFADDPSIPYFKKHAVAQ